MTFRSLYPALHRTGDSGWVSSECALFEASRISKCFMVTAAGELELNDAEKSFKQPVIRLTCDAAVRMREFDVDQPSYRESILARESG